MKTLNLKGEVEEIELFGQLSDTGKAFDCGYYIGGGTAPTYFSTGEEIERDKYLKDNHIYDKETPNWESLCNTHEDSFYYSEWYVNDSLDGGYSINGTYFLYNEKSKLFIRE